MSPETVCLRSPLSSAECVARLVAAIDPEPSIRGLWANAALPKLVIGSVRGSAVRLRKRSDLCRNSFQTYLHAELRPAGTGTLLVGRLQVHPFVRGFMGCWFAFLALLLLVVALTTFLGPASQNASADRWHGLLLLLGMMAFGGALVIFGRHLARDEGDFLQEFLVTTLDAESSANP